MSRLRFPAALAAVLSVTACDGLREAMTAHVDVVARAESHELSVQRLAELMGKASVPVTPQVARSLADLWVSYQLVAQAAARGDSLADTTLIDEAMWPVYANTRTQKWANIVSETWDIDTTNLEQKYNEGALLSAKHILFRVPPDQAATGSDSVLRRAESVLRQTTSANFAAMARRYGSDGTAQQGGDLGVFSPEQMVPEFSRAIMALEPGEIGPLVRTQYGYHIVRRNTFAEAREQFAPRYAALARQRAASLYVQGVDSAGKVEFRPNLARTVKAVAADPDDHRDDRTVVATSVLGEFTGADVARWINAMDRPEQARAQIQQSPDSALPDFVRYLVRNELLLRQADSANVQLEPSEIASIREAFRALVRNTWAGLRVSPHMLADSASTPQERERLAAARVDAYLERLLLEQEGYVEIPAPLAAAVRQRFDSRVNAAGLTRAVETAQRIRATADSARAAAQPKSAVPAPPGAGQGRNPQ
ncbi:MAG TPA: peptidylprolyl isomerase [Gemmatimonadaceae bacterium]